ncbi:MAG: hypothetical protein AB7S75_24045 [Desulfococcaceae bacterium]
MNDIFTRFVIFFSHVVIPVVLVFWVMYFAGFRMITRKSLPAKWLWLSFFVSWFLSSLPGFFYGKSAYAEWLFLCIPAFFSFISLSIFSHKSK